MATIAITIRNLPNCAKLLDTKTGILINVFNKATTTKKIINQGNTFLKLKSLLLLVYFFSCIDR